jgi:hypothetical protein
LSGREPKEVEELKEGRESVVLEVGGRKGGFWKRERLPTQELFMKHMRFDYRRN